METVCAAAREERPAENRPLVAPIYQTAVWTLDSAEQCEAVYEGATRGFIYTRDANPNHGALEQVVAALEHAETAVAFSSGMGAIAAAVTGLCRSGDRIVASRQLYGPTARFLSEEASRFGIHTDYADVDEPDALEAAISEGAALVLVETIANPLVQVADLPRLAAVCRRRDTLLVVDNTFATPYCCRALEHGADISIHSVTKSLGGHSDLTLGAAAGSAQHMERLRRYSGLWGGAANPFESWLALRGIGTFPLRMERCCENALDLARRLEDHPGVRRVYYPGLPSHPQHALACELMSAFGFMLAFELANGHAAREALRGLRHVRFAPSLGDVATTISYPAITSHRNLDPDERGAQGITDGVLRLSVGIDHVEDVWADLSQAIAG